VWGRDVQSFVEWHENDDTPVGAHSPITKLPLAGGKILMLGCSGDHNTSLHGVEEAGGAPYVLNKNNAPVCYTMRDGNGREFTQKVYRHTIGPKYAQRYARVIPLLGQDEVRMGKVLDADCVLMSAPAVWKKGVEMLNKAPYYFVEPM
jgi:aminoglycoside N3'-acetyltransferase